MVPTVVAPSSSCSAPRSPCQQSLSTGAPQACLARRPRRPVTCCLVLKMYPEGLDLAQLKPTIHKIAGLWVSEAFLGYKGLRNLIKSPTLSKACWTERVGSCNRVFGFETPSGQEPAGGHCYSSLGNQQQSEQVWSSSVVDSLGCNLSGRGDFLMGAVSL